VAVRGAHLAPVWPKLTPSGVLQGPLPPPPETGGPPSHCLDLLIFRGEPVAEVAGLQPTPRRVAPQSAPPGLGSFETGAGGQPGAMVWPLRTNHAVRRGMGPMTGSRNAQLRTPPVTPRGFGGGGVGGPVPPSPAFSARSPGVNSSQQASPSVAPDANQHPSPRRKDWIQFISC
jgi:hypothetical protein